MTILYIYVFQNIVDKSFLGKKKKDGEESKRKGPETSTSAEASTSASQEGAVAYGPAGQPVQSQQILVDAQGMPIQPQPGMQMVPPGMVLVQQVQFKISICHYSIILSSKAWLEDL